METFEGCVTEADDEENTSRFESTNLLFMIELEPANRAASFKSDILEVEVVTSREECTITVGDEGEDEDIINDDDKTEEDDDSGAMFTRESKSWIGDKTEEDDDSGAIVFTRESKSWIGSDISLTGGFFLVCTRRSLIDFVNGSTSFEEGLTSFEESFCAPYWDSESLNFWTQVFFKYWDSESLNFWTEGKTERFDDTSEDFFDGEVLWEFRVLA